MATEIEDDRAAEIASALAGKVRTGETIIVRKGEAGIEVRSSDETPLRRTHPELYGQLLAANEQVVNAGVTYIWVLGLISLGVCVAIHRGWFTKIGSLPIEKFQSFWTYPLVFVAGFIISMYLTEFAEARVYHRWKRSIVEALEKAGMGHYHLLQQIEGHVEVKAIGDLVKRDQEFRRVD
jgi:hypothetical protein